MWRYVTVNLRKKKLSNPVKRNLRSMKWQRYVKHNGTWRHLPSFRACNRDHVIGPKQKIQIHFNHRPSKWRRLSWAEIFSPGITPERRQVSTVSVWRNYLHLSLLVYLDYFFVLLLDILPLFSLNLRDLVIIVFPVLISNCVKIRHVAGLSRLLWSLGAIFHMFSTLRFI